MIDFDEEYFENLKRCFREIQEAFEHLSDSIDQLSKENDFFEREPIPETPYIFRGQARVYDKRPHKQHRCRNNC